MVVDHFFNTTRRFWNYEIVEVDIFRSVRLSKVLLGFLRRVVSCV